MEATSILDLLGCFAVAGELGRGQPAGHVSRTAALAVATADRLGLDPAERSVVLQTSLLVHAGCTAGASEVSAALLCDELALMRDVCICDPSNELEAMRVLLRHAGRGGGAMGRLKGLARLPTAGAAAMHEMEAGCSDVGSRVASRLGMPEATSAALANICETWNGKGFLKHKGDEIPVAARIVTVCMVAEIFLSNRGAPAAIAVVRKRAGRAFDPDVSRAVIDLLGDEAALAAVKRATEWAAVAELDAAPPAMVGADEVDVLTLACADFTDLKVPGRAAHSRRVGQLAEAVMLRLGHRGEARLARWAGHVHAVGQVGLPVTLVSGEPLSIAENEQLRLHSIFTRRVLAHSPALATIGHIAGMHHERADGRGYPEGRSGADFPPAARAVAAACAWDDLRLQQPDQPSADTIPAFRESGRDAFGADLTNALCDEVAGAAPTRPPAGPEGLTAREVEVLTLAAKGKTVGEIAQSLVISKHTARHHLESIYEKAGVSCRAEATLFAIEAGLLG